MTFFYILSICISRVSLYTIHVRASASASLMGKKLSRREFYDNRRINAIIGERLQLAVHGTMRRLFSVKVKNAFIYEYMIFALFFCTIRTFL